MDMAIQAKKLEQVSLPADGKVVKSKRGRNRRNAVARTGSDRVPMKDLPLTGPEVARGVLRVRLGEDPMLASKSARKYSRQRQQLLKAAKARRSSVAS